MNTTTLMEQPTGPKIQPACTHFPECNGCPFMELDYAAQIQMKEKYLRSLFGRAISIESSANRQFYRNKAELSFLNGKLGFRRKANFSESFSAHHCLLVSEQAQQVTQVLEKELNELGLSGKVRYAVLREGKRTREFLVTLVSNTLQIEKELERIAHKLLEQFKVSGVIWLVNNTLSDTSQGTRTKVWGESSIEEHFMNLRFKIGYNNFFQANVVQAEKLFTQIVGQVQAHEKVLDVFCGVGALTLPLAREGLFVHGIELVPESIEQAKVNANLNGIGNVEFMAGNARKVLKENNFEADLVCLDPPRAGADKKTVDRIASTGTQRVFYVSCNPVTLQRDLNWFEEAGMVLKNLKAFDFFPNTKHVECLAELGRA